MRIIGLLSGCLLLAAAVGAAPVVLIGPAEGKFSASGHYQRLAERKVEHSLDRTLKFDADYTAYVARFHYGLFPKVEIYGEVGSVDANLDQRGGASLFTNLSTGNELLWGLGIQGILYDAGNWNLAGDAQYLATDGHSGTATGGATNGVKWDFDWREWHVAMQAQTTIDRFHPWLGVKYSDAEGNNLVVNGVKQAAILEAENNAGVYGGVATLLNDKTAIYVEGRFIDETAFGAGVKYTW